MTKSMQMCSKFQKWNKKIHETFKGSDRVPNFRSFFLRNLFKFRREKKGFVPKIRNLLGFAINIMVLYKTQCGTLRFSTKS